MVQQVWASLLAPIPEVLRQGLVIGVGRSRLRHLPNIPAFHYVGRGASLPTSARVLSGRLEARPAGPRSGESEGRGCPRSSRTHLASGASKSQRGPFRDPSPPGRPSGPHGGMASWRFPPLVTVSRRGVTTRASPDSEAGRGPVLGRATAQEGEGCSCSRRLSGTPRRRSAGQTGRDGDGA